MNKLPPGTKRIAFVGDIHAGHRAGLTPPDWQLRPETGGHTWQKFAKVQQETWNRYREIVKVLSPVDCLVVNGDCIDGRGERSGGTELITGDRNEQAAIAFECINFWKAPVVVMTRGTAYHTGDKEDFEDQIAGQLADTGAKVKIGDHEWIDINGFVFDVKHHISSSSVPYGRITAMAKDEVWNAIWHEAGLQPRADFVIRSHVHTCCGGYRYVGGKKREFMTLPALQAMGTRFGARRCSGTVDWGVVAFDINKRGEITCRREHVYSIESSVAKAFRV